MYPRVLSTASRGVVASLQGHASILGYFFRSLVDLSGTRGLIQHDPKRTVTRVYVYPLFQTRYFRVLRSKLLLELRLQKQIFFFISPLHAWTLGAKCMYVRYHPQILQALVSAARRMFASAKVGYVWLEVSVEQRCHPRKWIYEATRKRGKPPPRERATLSSAFSSCRSRKRNDTCEFEEMRMSRDRTANGDAARSGPATPAVLRGFRVAAGVLTLCGDTPLPCSCSACIFHAASAGLCGDFEGRLIFSRPISLVRFRILKVDVYAHCPLRELGLQLSLQSLYNHSEHCSLVVLKTSPATSHIDAFYPGVIQTIDPNFVSHPQSTRFYYSIVVGVSSVPRRKPFAVQFHSLRHNFSMFIAVAVLKLPSRLFEDSKLQVPRSATQFDFLASVFLYSLRNSLWRYFRGSCTIESYKCS